MTDALVIGAGPAGLMAAEMLADAGYSVLVADAKPSVGRKFLMAGKSGLNLTKDEPFPAFLSAFENARNWLRPSLQRFGPKDVVTWAESLRQPVFTGSSGRVFPKSMKASPLLRNWLTRLTGKSVTFRTKWQWVGWNDTDFTFQTQTGLQTIRPKATILALGGASWARLGSDGAWTALLASRNIALSPFQPSNIGITLRWSQHMQPHFGAPLKNIAFATAQKSRVGECVISKTGLEGSLVYQFSSAFRQGAKLQIDLMPDTNLEALTTRLEKHSPKTSLSNLLRKTLRFDPAKTALFMEFARTTARSDIAKTVKALPVHYTGTAPMDQAISVAGGVSEAALTENLMLHAAPGVFCAGEMLDWEAPTGGYLITACLATGRTAGLAAAAYIKQAGCE